MKTTKYLAILCVGILFGLQSEKPRVLATLPDAKYLFGLSAAPRESNMFVFASPNENEGEVNEAIPTIIRFRNPGQPLIKPIRALATPRSYDSGMLPVWTQDGNIVYFETGDGVVSYDLADDHLETVWSGNAHGLALSRNGEYLAFWNLSELYQYQLKLVLFDVKIKKVKQTWVTAIQYGGDLEGFGIAFASDDRSIYARAFDAKEGSPFKRFTIGSVNPETVSTNVTSVVSGENAVYFVTERLVRDSLVYTLMAISDSVSLPELLKSDLPCESLVVSGSSRWIICKDEIPGKASLLFDSEKRTFTPFKPLHDNMVVMSDGKVVYSLKGKIFTDDAFSTMK
jgi:hypothetical protein